jgi:outer membrane receptor protein involved in Fe transport
LISIAGAVYAQEQPAAAGQKQQEQLQEVVITGSRIARPDLDRLEPTTVVNSEVFEQRGYTDVGQALSELPAFGIQSSAAQNVQGGFGVAQSFVDLYSLGSQRTLVLVNGRRFVSSSTASLFNGATPPGQQVDLNVVPTGLIERVETVSVGGAPIYGADAIAGTVNIILKKDYEGLQLDADAGVSNVDDAWNYRFRVLGGVNFADGRGNVTLSGEAYKADGLVGNARFVYGNNAAFLSPPAGTNTPYASLYYDNTHIAPISTSGIPMTSDFFLCPACGIPLGDVGIPNGGGGVLAWHPGQTTLGNYNFGTPTGSVVFSQGGDGATLSQFSNLLSPIERYNLDGTMNFKFTDHFAMFAEGWFNESHATNIVQQPVYSTAFFGAGGTQNGNWLVSTNNPYLSAADRTSIINALTAAGADTSAFYVARANTDLQSGRAVADQVVGRGVLGINGDFNAGSRNFTWEVAANYGYSRDINRQPSLVWQNALNALNSQIDPATGNIVCAPNAGPAPVTTPSSTCAPLNIFGQGSPSNAALQYLTHNALATSINTQADFTANISGDIIKLPAGELKMAAGFEHRRETAEFEPDSFLQGPGGGSTLSYGVGGAIAPVEGDYHTNEFYAEALVPIFESFQNIPALYQLELEGAFRRVDNSIAGDANIYTYGLRWAPIQDVLFRGNKTRSVRAPAITELFLPGSTNFEFANDPCDARFINQGTNPTQRAANCAAAGIVQPFTSNVVNATAQGITSGNPNLTSETADSKTFGVVLRPRFAQRLNISADYIQINLSNAIEQLNLGEILDACYDASDYPNNPSCNQFTRNAQHQITNFHDGFRNAGLLDFEGISIGADWGFTLPKNLGDMELRANWLNTRKLEQQIGAASPNSIMGELNQLIAAPQDAGTFDVNYHKAWFQWYWQARYIGPMNFDNQNTATSQNILGVSHWWLINSTLTFNVNNHFTTRFIVNNVFNKEPPFPAIAGTGGNFASSTSLYFAGIIGRTYLLSLQYQF